MTEKDPERETLAKQIVLALLDQENVYAPGPEAMALVTGAIKGAMDSLRERGIPDDEAMEMLALPTGVIFNLAQFTAGMIDELRKRDIPVGDFLSPNFDFLEGPLEP